MHVRGKNVTEILLQGKMPLAGGENAAAKKALQASGKFIPWQVVTISLDGKILD